MCICISDNEFLASECSERWSLGFNMWSVWFVQLSLSGSGASSGEGESVCVLCMPQPWPGFNILLHLYLCICVFVYLCICVFVYLYICISVFVRRVCVLCMAQPWPGLSRCLIRRGKSLEFLLATLTALWGGTRAEEGLVDHKSPILPSSDTPPAQTLLHQPHPPSEWCSGVHTVWYHGASKATTLVYCEVGGGWWEWQWSK